MFRKKKKSNAPKLILATIGAITTIGGVIFGLTKLKKRNELEAQFDEACCYCDEEELEDTECTEEDLVEESEDEVEFTEETEEENK